MITAASALHVPRIPVIEALGAGRRVWAITVSTLTDTEHLISALVLLADKVDAVRAHGPTCMVTVIFVGGFGVVMGSTLLASALKSLHPAALQAFTRA